MFLPRRLRALVSGSVDSGFFSSDWGEESFIKSAIKPAVSISKGGRGSGVSFGVICGDAGGINAGGIYSAPTTVGAGMDWIRLAGS